MGRWEPNALERLQKAAMDLFLERGYDRTTVGDIAARAKLTERTFFRYFTDKREVLFSGTAQLEKIIVDAIARAPQTTTPLDTVASALEATATMFEERRPHSRKRQALILAHTELQERELVKLAKLTSAIAGGLRERGVPKVAAGLVAETGIIVFKNAFERWIRGSEKVDLAHHVRATLADLAQATGATSPSPTEKASPPTKKKVTRSRARRVTASAG